MTHFLVIRSSANGASSASNRLIDSFLAALPEGAAINERDLDREPVPHVTSRTLAGIGRVAPETPDFAATRALSDALIAEVKAADTIVIGAPMYNFGIPTLLKSWFDHVLRAGETFRYTAEGQPEGLVPGRRAIIIATRAGAYGDASPVDMQVPHLKTMLGFMGITDVTVVVAEGLVIDAAGAIAAAESELRALAGATVPA